MTKSQVITEDNDFHGWEEALSQFPISLRDPYYEKNYVTLDSLKDRTKAALFTYESGEHFYLLPFLIHKIESICGDSLKKPIIDLETAYGYGGPISTTHDHRFVLEADTAFRNWCNEIGVVAEFLRFHPLLGTHDFAGKDVSVELNRTTYSITINSLIPPIENFRGTARNRVRGAIKNGLHVQELELENGIPQFKHLYLDLMNQKNASRNYNFSDHYFDGLSLYSPQDMILLAVNDTHGILSMGLFLVGPNGIYYHLGASVNRPSHSGAFNLLMNSAVEFAIKKNLKWIHIGGGLSSDGSDSLAHFKRTISNTSHQYYIGKRLHRPEIWREAHSKLRKYQDKSSIQDKFLEYHLFP